MTTSPVETLSLRQPSVVWASGLGLGFLPAGPGTWGSVGALLVWWFLLADLPLIMQGLICAGYFLTGWWCSEDICRRYGIQDAPQIVADEVAGMWLALLLLPRVWWLGLAALLVFRVLDIAKPGPIGWLDREVKGGLGVMLDDVLAGVITGAVLLVALWAIRAAGINL